jgi:hypothetical protein
VAKVIERTRARYEVEDVEYGKVYRWKPESVVVECGCGEKTSLTHLETACEECGAEHRASSESIWQTTDREVIKMFTPGAIRRTANTTRLYRTEEAFFDFVI